METFAKNIIENLERAGWLESGPAIVPPLTDDQQAALDAVRAEPGRGVSAIAQELDKARTTLQNTLVRLESMSLIARSGSPPRWYPVTFVPRGDADNPR